MVTVPHRNTVAGSDFVARLSSAFSHPTDVNKVIRSYDLRKELLAQRPLRIALAPDWSRCREQRPGQEAKVSIAGVVRSLAELSAESRHWDTVLSNMTQIPLLEADTAPEHRSAALPTRKGLPLLGKRSTLAERVQLWLSMLIGDEAIVKSLGLDTAALAESVTRLSAQIPSQYFKGVRREMPLIDINVLRFPDADYPFFELYRLKIDAWFQRWPLFSFRRAANGFTGVFQAYRFRPQKSIINDLAPQTVEKAVQEAEALLDSEG
ncbi:hypothetical protein PsYK624_047930 [Phanerochaete sordida]|uniref:Uncharacterized protein n=1 Tax=Phanerochaete sordida TaxID=48140 RepID=A0A9P3G723_9APHY|nr:hypothetical protein PsYK624_047930 [Phanerochaete sordida]